MKRLLSTLLISIAFNVTGLYASETFVACPGAKAGQLSGEPAIYSDCRFQVADNVGHAIIFKGGPFGFADVWPAFQLNPTPTGVVSLGEWDGTRFIQDFGPGYTGTCEEITATTELARLEDNHVFCARIGNDKGGFALLRGTWNEALNTFTDGQVLRTVAGIDSEEVDLPPPPADEDNADNDGDSGAVQSGALTRILALLGVIESPSAAKFQEPTFSPVALDELQSKSECEPPDVFYVWSVLDLNGDDFLDIFIGGAKAPFVDELVLPQALINDGNGGFTEDLVGILESDSRPPSLVHAREGAVADFNGDGQQDIVVASTGWDDPAASFPMERNLLLLSQPSGKYRDVATAGSPFDYLGFTHSLAVGDVDLDGDQDIVFVDLFVGEPCPCPVVRVLYNNGAGSFTSEGMRDIEGFWTTSTLADVNNDSYPDLVLGGGDSNEKSAIFTNDGSGHFSSSSRKDLPTRSDYPINTDLLSADLNNDGRVDFLVAGTREDRFYVGRFLQVLIDNGLGGYKDETDVYLPDIDTNEKWITDMELVDVNGNGRKDLVLKADVIVSEGWRFLLMRQPGGKFDWSTSTSLAQGTPIPLDADGDDDTDIFLVVPFPNRDRCLEGGLLEQR